jgi:hypothetical protein
MSRVTVGRQTKDRGYPSIIRRVTCQKFCRSGNDNGSVTLVDLIEDLSK